jgi:hypothetical protein
MCSGCGAPPSNIDWYSAGVPDSPGGRIQARTRLARAANAVLTGSGLSVTFYQGASSLSMRNTGGATEPVQTLSDVWTAASKLSGIHLDPLAPRFTCRPSVSPADD